MGGLIIRGFLQEMIDTRWQDARIAELKAREDNFVRDLKAGKVWKWSAGMVAERMAGHA